eukprot:TRINITY_DN15648_c0_g1_i1.p1 TRINITY_DN15648_c0_g1~~TRINITY_DN15648_c0_g1_i1.p1  ORF type:complete len:1255 (+),score=288.83 TRINITY_DN15648_c0_g1_i1:53-3817(+)
MDSLYWEIQSILAEIRQNHYRAKRDPIVRRLREVWRSLSKPQPHSALLVVQPLLDMVSTPEISAALTATVLASLQRLVSTGIIDAAPDAAEVLTKMVVNVVQCKFESGDAHSEDSVLLRVLQVLLACTRCASASSLTDENVIQMVLACLRIYVHPRLSPIVKTATEDTLLDIVHRLFQYGTLPGVAIQFGDKALASVLRHLATSCDDTAQRYLCVRAAAVALDAMGRRLCDSVEVLDVACDQLFLALLQCAVQQESALVVAALRGLEQMVRVVPNRLVYQTEALFCTVFQPAARGGARHPASFATLECLSKFCSTQDQMAHLYIAYDCNRAFSDVFETLCKELSKNAFPVAESLSETHLLSLECLLHIVDSIGMACGPVSEQASTIAALLRTERQYKHQVAPYIDTFNAAKEKQLNKAVAELRASGVIGPSLADLAVLFRTHGTVSTVKLSEYFSNPANIDALQAFADSYDFRGLGFVQAMREYLCGYKLPREAQQIDRCVEAFSRKYHHDNPTVLDSPDAAYVLAFAVIMLHTDLYNPLVKNKMTLQHFMRNCRPAAEGDPEYSEEFMTAVFNDVASMKIPFATDGFLLADVTERWVTLVRRSCQFQPKALPPACAVARDMFACIWGQVAAAISAVFDAAESSNVLNMSIQGFYSCARIAAHHGMDEVLDNLIITLCKLSKLLEPENAVHTLRGHEKSKAAAVALFDLAREDGNHLREAWRKVVDCIMRLNSDGLLAPLLKLDEDVEREMSDAVLLASPAPVVVPSQAWPGAMLSSLSSYLSLTPDPPAPPDEAAVAAARQMVVDFKIDELFSDTSYLKEESLQFLVKALILAAQKPADAESAEGAHLTSLQMVLAVALRNRDRFFVMWDLFRDQFTKMIVAGGKLAAHATVGVISVCMRLPRTQDASKQLTNALGLLTRLPPTTATAIAAPLARGLKLLALSVVAAPVDSSFWTLMFTLLEAASRQPASLASGLEALAVAIREAHINDDIAAVMAATLQSYINTDGSARALELLYAACMRTALDASEVSGDMPLKVQRLLRVVTAVARDARASVAMQAIDILQRVLLLPAVRAVEASGWETLLSSYMFPLLSDMVNSNAHVDLVQRAYAITCKAFLHSLAVIVPAGSVTRMWDQMLACAALCPRAKSDILSEAVMEALKNMLLVLASSEALPEPAWESTWKLVNDLFPHLQVELNAALTPPEPMPVLVVEVAHEAIQQEPVLSGEGSAEGSAERSEPQPSSTEHSTPVMTDT